MVNPGALVSVANISLCAGEEPLSSIEAGREKLLMTTLRNRQRKQVGINGEKRNTSPRVLSVYYCSTTKILFSKKSIIYGFAIFEPSCL